MSSLEQNQVKKDGDKQLIEEVTQSIVDYVNHDFDSLLLDFQVLREINDVSKQRYVELMTVTNDTTRKLSDKSGLNLQQNKYHTIELKTLTVSGLDDTLGNISSLDAKIKVLEENMEKIGSYITALEQKLGRSTNHEN